MLLLSTTRWQELSLGVSPITLVVQASASWLWSALPLSFSWHYYEIALGEAKACFGRMCAHAGESGQLQILWHLCMIFTLTAKITENERFSNSDHTELDRQHVHYVNTWVPSGECESFRNLQSGVLTSLIQVMYEATRVKTVGLFLVLQPSPDPKLTMPCTSHALPPWQLRGPPESPCCIEKEH